MSYRLYKELYQCSKKNPSVKFVFKNGEIVAAIPYTGFADTNKSIQKSIADNIKKSREESGAEISADVGGTLFHSQQSVEVIEFKGHAAGCSPGPYPERWDDGIHIEDSIYEGDMIYEVKFHECKDCAKEQCVLNNKSLCEQELAKGISAAAGNNFER